MIVGIVIGLAIGSIYGLTSMGLVLTYRTSGVFNLAHGAMGMVGTYTFWQVHQKWGWPLGLSLVVVLGVVAPAIGMLAHLLVFRWVRDRALAVSLVAGIAVLVAAQGIASAIWGTAYNPLHSLFPFRVYKGPAGVNVTTEQLGTMLLTGAVAVVLFVYLQRTRFGLYTRAVVDNRELAELSGYSSETIQLASWTVASMLATLSGILISPFTGLTVTGLTLVVIQAMACAVVGRLRSLTLTYAAGLGLGVLESMLARYLPAGQVAQGLKVSAAFLVLYAVVVLGTTVYRAFSADVGAGLRSGLLGREEGSRSVLPLLVAFGVVAVALFAAGPYVRFLLTAGLVASIALQSFVLFTGLGGEVSLCQVAFVGVGATLYSRAVTEWHLPIVVAVVLALVVAVLLGLFVSIPAVRIRGLPLTLLTLAFALFMDSFVFPIKTFSGGYTGFTIKRPDLFGLHLDSQVTFQFVVLIVALVIALGVRNLSNGRSGRVLRAVKNSEVAAESAGISVRRTKLALFSLASLFAGIAGVLTALQIQSVASIQFNVSQSILFLAVAVLGGVSSPIGALTGGMILHLLPEFLNKNGLGDYQQIAFGVGAAALLMAGRGGLGDILSRAISTLFAGPDGRRATVAAGRRAALPERSHRASPQAQFTPTEVGG